MTQAEMQANLLAMEETYKRVIVSLKAESKKKDGTIQHMVQENKRLEAQATPGGFTQRVSELEAETARLNREHEEDQNDADGEIIDLKDELKAKRDEARALMTQRDAARRLYARTKAELATVSDEVFGLKGELKAERAMRYTADAKIATMTAEMFTLKANLQKAKAPIEDKRIAVLQGEIAAARDLIAWQAKQLFEAQREKTGYQPSPEPEAPPGWSPPKPELKPHYLPKPVRGGDPRLTIATLIGLLGVIVLLVAVAAH